MRGLVWVGAVVLAGCGGVSAADLGRGLTEDVTSDSGAVREGPVGQQVGVDAGAAGSSPNRAEDSGSASSSGGSTGAGGSTPVASGGSSAGSGGHYAAGAAGSGGSSRLGAGGTSSGGASGSGGNGTGGHTTGSGGGGRSAVNIGRSCGRVDPDAIGGRRA